MITAVLPTYNRAPIAFVKGEGSWLTAEDGTRYLDFNLTPTTNYPVNLGMACPKGWEALTVLNSPDRATTPLLRDAGGTLRPAEWDAALRTFCQRFKSIQKQHGPHSIAFLSTGQIPTEEMALLGSLAKFGMGMLHGDGNTRQCMATSVVMVREHTFTLLIWKTPSNSYAAPVVCAEKS